MNDRELLERSAKAAGYDDIAWSTLHEHWFAYKGDKAEPWNPLTDDGDAFRLAVKLGLFSDTGLTFNFMEAADCEATRRVIVRAAAIGKTRVFEVK